MEVCQPFTRNQAHRSDGIELCRGMGLSSSCELKQDLDTLKTQNHQLQAQEMMLDEYINLMQNSLREIADDGENEQCAFVTHDDIRNLRSMDGDTIVAIKAPGGTTLEVPDPDEVRDSDTWSCTQLLTVRSCTCPCVRAWKTVTDATRSSSRAPWGL